MFALAFLGLVEGDVKRITHGMDYNGRLCGVDEAVKDLPFLYYCGFLERAGDYPKHLNYQSRSCVAECPTNSSEQIPCIMPEFVNTTMLGGGVQGNLAFDSTFDVQITQSVAYQLSYPSEKHLDRYCVPKPTSENDLYSRVVNGPLKKISQFNGVVLSFKRAWPVILGVAVFAVLLGVGYLHMLKNYAGIVLYFTLWLGTVMTGLFGLFILYGLFPDPWDELGWYQQTSPIFVICVGPAARFSSLITGFVLLATSACMLFSVLNENIDESIGIVCAACDCILGQGSGCAFVVQPVTQAFAGAALMFALFVGYMLIASVTEIDRDLMSMNGIFVPKEPYAQQLMAKEVRTWYWELAMQFYVFGAVWLMITFITFCQFVTTYAVCDWFFIENDMQPNPAAQDLPEAVLKASSGKGKRVDGVRVRGVDKVAGGRSGYITRTGGIQMLVVPMGQRGPDGRDFIRVEKEISVKSLPGLCVMTEGICAGVFYHLGTIAVAGVVNLATAPFRAASEMFKTFVGAGGKPEYRAGAGGIDEEDRSRVGLIISGLGLLSTFLDEFFGRFSKNMLSDVVLRSTDFSTASSDAYEFVLDAGGVVALLHGGTGNYEVIGVIIITAKCALLNHLLLTKIYTFSSPESNLYVDEPGMMTLIAAAMACVIASGFMSLFSIASDTLLYTFVFGRKLYADQLKDFIPTPLMHMLGNEIEDAPSVALQAQPRSRLTRFSHAASKYKDTVMSTMRGRGGRSESSPLLVTSARQ
mmetsp:Transcript_169614/g.538510  ORF Transcript_169614/g.538510 Transcript_169614/m.538510 type:complete len:753 (+) Transcript_169614:98-2356(+)